MTSKKSDLEMEKRAVAAIETFYMRRDKPYLPYTAGEQWEYEWEPEQVELLIQMWKEGAKIWELASIFKRRLPEVAILIMDLGDKGRLSRKDIAV